MMKLLIVDRDQTERQGIKWFVQSYHFPFSQIVEAASSEEAVHYIQQVQPEVVCLELDLIPEEIFEQVVYHIKSHVQKVICLTTEPVFERAIQAIELNANALLVKPVSLEHLKRVLSQAARHPFSAKQNVELAEQNGEFFGYSSMFIDQNIEREPPCLILIQPERRYDNKKLYEWLQGYYFPYPIRHYPLSDMIVCLVDLTIENQYQILQVEGQRLIQRWQEDHQSHITLSIHPNFVLAPSLHQMYLRTRDALKLQFFKGYQQVYWVNETPSFIEIDPFLTPEEQRAWIGYLESNEKEAIKNWMYQAFTQFEGEYPHPDLLRIKLTSILAQLRRFLLTYHLDQDVDLERKYHQVFQTILYTPILFRIVQEMLLFCYELLDKVQRQRTTQAYDVIERALQFIDQNYSLPSLSLEDVAHFLDLSPSYFSSLLSKRRQKTFRQILTERRIHEVKKELLASNTPIQEIALQVGFNDPNYLTRVFKEQVGITPRKYRQCKGLI